MPSQTALVDALEQWKQQGGSVFSHISEWVDQPVETTEAAEAICDAIEHLRVGLYAEAPEDLSSNLDVLSSFFQDAGSAEVFEVFSEYGLPLLRPWVEDALNGEEIDENTVLFLLKILSIYEQEEDTELIARVARQPFCEQSFIWSVILAEFDPEHEYALLLVDLLRDPLPKGFLGVAFLDMVNMLCLDEVLEDHPFNTNEGFRTLHAWLSDPSDDYYSYAHSATASLPYLSPQRRDLLLEIAEIHPSAVVRLEAAWVAAKFGSEDAIEKLVQWSLDPRYSMTATEYLAELGHSDSIPETVQTSEFLAVAAMANWLSHPAEYGYPPTSIELMDTRELYWPPTEDMRQVYLVKYAYASHNPNEPPDEGVGMFGSVTFSLFGETTSQLPPEDIYGLHCCWELEINQDKRAPKNRSAQAGRAILREENDGF